MADKIAYEVHPVSPERKKELRKQGYKILDAKFAPDEPKEPEVKPAQAKTRKAAK